METEFQTKGLPPVDSAGRDSMLEMNKDATGAAHRFDDEDAVVDVYRRWIRIQHVFTKLLTRFNRPISMCLEMSQTAAMAAALDSDGAPNLVLRRSMEFGAHVVHL
ncbi:hypothetical protein ACLOJK_034932 [Asimina triloba]